MTTDPRHLAYQRPPTLSDEVQSIRNQLWQITDDIPMTVRQRDIIKTVKERLWDLHEKLNTLSKASNLDQTLGELPQLQRLQKQLARCKLQRDLHAHHRFDTYEKKMAEIELDNKELEAIT